MAKLDSGEQVWLQLLIKPVGDEWQEKGHKIIEAVRTGKKPGGQALLSSLFGGLKQFAHMVVLQAIKPGAEIAAAEAKPVTLPGTVEEALKSIEYKIVKLGFETKIRVLCLSKDPISAKVKCQNVAAAFKQFNTTNLNGFKIGEVYINDAARWEEFIGRKFSGAGNILNISELASLYHLPHETVATPNIVWSGSKKGEPPANLPSRENTAPEDLTIIGQTNFRNINQEFGIRRDDRRRHIYIVGKSGTGKSTLIENMAIDDVVEGRGVIIVDPHGELADKVLACVPENRIDDVIVFDPADRAYPIAFNLLEHVDDDFKGMVASGFVGIFKKIFGDSWGPRLEHILRNTVLALLDYPESTMLDIPRMLTDNRFRDKVVEKVQDSVIKEFWVNEFAQYDSKFRTEAVSPILNKVGQFLSTATIRNLVGQPYSRINIREVMDQEKILVVNLSRGKIGEDNSALLGAMMITKIQLAAMSRADVTADKRPDAYLYVDEFQNFATDSFAVILSEARKYNLSLTMAHQYIEQMPEQVRSAVFGNAGTLVAFRVGGSDADFLVKEYEPVFDANDLVNLDKYHIYIKLLVNGISSPAFSARTLPPVAKITGSYEKIIATSREKYANTRAVVEEQIAGINKREEEELRREAMAYKKGGLQALIEKRSENGPVPTMARTTPVINQIGEKMSASNTVSHNGATSSVHTINASGEIEDNSAGNNAGVQAVSAPPAEQNMTVQRNEESTGVEEAKPKQRLMRYQNIIGDTLYKEQTSKGGVKWYVGEIIDEAKLAENGIIINDTARQMMELARKAEQSDKTAKKDVASNDSGQQKQKDKSQSNGEKNEVKRPANNHREEKTDIKESVNGMIAQVQQKTPQKIHEEGTVTKSGHVVDNKDILIKDNRGDIKEKEVMEQSKKEGSKVVNPIVETVVIVPDNEDKKGHQFKIPSNLESMINDHDETGESEQIFIVDDNSSSQQQNVSVINDSDDNVVTLKEGEEIKL
ncbi:MAG: AAA-like domain protein [bacterium ADurb.Bin400]|nr:MAG: AAA-like domain protein [bacterium ADurb.Bin400]